MVSDPCLFGVDLFGDPVKQRGLGAVAERFTMPPFTILDARGGEWQNRKRAWLSLGIRGEEGRKAGMTYMEGKKSPEYWAKKMGEGWVGSDAGTSVFDPVLVELAYRWFCPAGGQVVDPFAGGSVRGIVAGMLGLKYWGCDIRSEQVSANESQANTIAPAVMPVWVCGDSLDTLAESPLADFVFSCPPYGDLEHYSDEKGDLSNMDWHAFAPAYKRIIMRTVGRMREDSFACFVVGDFRGAGGFYRNFVGLTVSAFESAGALLYNEAILSTPVGTGALRVTKQFSVSRKMVKTHQNVLVFCKGDWRKAADLCSGE